MSEQMVENVVTVAEKSEVDKVLNNWRKSQADEGRRYPLSFLDELLFKANLVATTWIEQHKLPNQLSDLLDQAYCLRMAYGRAIGGKLEDSEAEQIPFMVQDIIVDIFELGGNFYDESADLKPNMPADWKPKE